MDNGLVEAVVVPEIGRVMQFRFRGEEGTFWDQPELHGKSPDPDSPEWGNFGGDKAWPAPQSEWGVVSPRSGPPPRAFDSMPYETETACDGDAVLLVSPVDPHYGIRVRRQVRLVPGEPEMRIRTRFEKIRGDSVKVAVWIVTQLRDPVRVFGIATPSGSMPAGYVPLWEGLPKDLHIEDSLFSLVRDPVGGRKIGTEGGCLLWVGREHMLLMTSTRRPDAVYADRGSSSEVWTNPDPLKYVELELLGPLAELKPGESTETEVGYRLFRRWEPDEALDARARRLLPSTGPLNRSL